MFSSRIAKGLAGSPDQKGSLYLNAKIVPSYTDQEVVGRNSGKLDRKSMRVIIPLNQQQHPKGTVSGW
jgi:hypothetical protein